MEQSDAEIEADESRQMRKARCIELAGSACVGVSGWRR